MMENLSAAGIAFLFAACLLPIAMRLAGRWNLYDAPGPLKIHGKQVARIGGTAMMGGLLAGILFAGGLAHKDGALWLLAFAFVWAVGLVDDVRTLPPATRFFAHLVAGAALWEAGYGLQWTNLTALNLAATCLFVAFLINAMNLFDGMDGLAAGTAAIAALGFIALYSGVQNSYPAAVAWSLLAVCLAVLVYNFPPARIFMGDSGSTLLGIALASLVLAWPRTNPGPNDSQDFLALCLFVALPLTDAFLAIVRRARARTSLFAGDRRHFYDLLLKRGWSPREILWFSFAITGLTSVIGWLCLRGVLDGGVAAPVVAVCLCGGGFLLGSLEATDKRLPFEQEQEAAPVRPHIE